MVHVSLQHLPVPINFLHELYRGETIQTTTLIEPIFDSNSKVGNGNLLVVYHILVKP